MATINITGIMKPNEMNKRIHSFLLKYQIYIDLFVFKRNQYVSTNTINIISTCIRV